MGRHAPQMHVKCNAFCNAFQYTFFLPAPEMLDPKAKVKGDLFPWLPKMPRAPSPLVQSSVQSYAIAQEEQNNSCLSKSGTTHR